MLNERQYQVIRQTTKGEYEEHLHFTGTYNECVEELEKLEKGYIVARVDGKVEMFKTKGWNIK